MTSLGPQPGRISGSPWSHTDYLFSLMQRALKGLRFFQIRDKGVDLSCVSTDLHYRKKKSVESWTLWRMLASFSCDQRNGKQTYWPSFILLTSVGNARGNKMGVQDNGLCYRNTPRMACKKNDEIHLGMSLRTARIHQPAMHQLTIGWLEASGRQVRPHGQPTAQVKQTTRNPQSQEMA